DQEANCRVDHRISENDLAAEFLSPVQPQEKEEHDQHGERFVKLRRMQMNGSELSPELLRPVSPLRRIVKLVDDSRNASDSIPLFRKLQSPPRSGRFTPATSRRETAQTPQHVTQSDS